MGLWVMVKTCINHNGWYKHVQTIKHPSMAMAYHFFHDLERGHLPPNSKRTARQAEGRDLMIQEDLSAECRLNCGVMIFRRHSGRSAAGLRHILMGHLGKVSS
jgi:hypothetical protein